VAVPGTGILVNNAPFLGGNPRGQNSWSFNIAWGNDPVMYDTDQFSAAENLVDTDPRLVDPAGSNFALQSGSPAIGAGTEVPYWPPSTPGTVDIGACAASLATCP
jgi:hypothetical protein